jgi:hypothetical protein
MQVAVATLALVMMAGLPVYGVKTDLKSGETCVGSGCAGTMAEPPAYTMTARDKGVQASASELCETVAQRVYDLCMASPGADPSRCSRDRDNAYHNCSDPPDKTTEADNGSSGADICNKPPYKNPPGSGGPSQATSAATSELSRGIYRIPYADGTKVHISRDFYDHNRPGKLDMSGRGGGPHRIVAAADGCIQYIVDSNTEQQWPQDQYRKEEECYNNYVWIKHANGEWTKYSHMRQGTTTGSAGLKVGDFVREGTYLGDEGMVGCAWPSHLHFEVVMPPTDHPAIGDPSGELQGYRREHARNPVVCGIEGRTFKDGETYVAVAGPGTVNPGLDEVIRHGMPKHNYQCFIDRALAAGYQTTWIDFFTLDNEVHVNVVMHPQSGSWASRSGMDADAFQRENQAFKGRGYRLTHLESYEDGGVRYAGLWEQGSGPAQQVYWGYSESEHQAMADSLKSQGYRPRTVSVVSRSGLQYTALWEQVSGGWELRSQLTPAEYSALAKENHARQWEVVYLNSYVHKGEAYIVAVWRPGITGEVRRRSGLGKKEFDGEWSVARKLGLLTTAVTAYEADGTAKYTAVFGE